jgi:hypothetical protein
VKKSKDAFQETSSDKVSVQIIEMTSVQGK